MAPLWLLARAGLLLLAASLPALCVEPLRAQHEAHLLSAKEAPLEHFKEWVSKHGKAYHSDLEEYKKRFSIWLANLEYAVAYNAKHSSHWLGLTHLADLTSQEYKQRYLGYNFAAKKALNAKAGSFKYASVSDAGLPPSGTGLVASSEHCHCTPLHSLSLMLH